MKILITGANGLLGHHVVMQLQQQQHEIRIILRGERDLYFDKTGIDIYNGTFTDYNSLKKAAEGCDAIIHIAAVTATDLLHYEDYSSVNTKGASNIIKVADDLKINRLVFVSTANTVGYGSPEKPADENCGIEYPFTKSFYAQSKVEAEKLFVEASKKTDRHVIIINPTFMIGAYDTKPSSGKLMLLGYRKRWMFAPSGGKNFVAVTDVATAVCNALTMGRNGERYLAAGINLSFAEFYKIQSRVGGYYQNLFIIPARLLEMFGKAGDFIRLLNVRTEICSRNLNQLTIREYYGNKKALKELQMPQKPLETAIKEALKWFENNGKIV
jgi:dihydroflavonol-4-reductase